MKLGAWDLKASKSQRGIEVSNCALELVMGRRVIEVNCELLLPDTTVRPTVCVTIKDYDERVVLKAIMESLIDTVYDTREEARAAARGDD